MVGAVVWCCVGCGWALGVGWVWVGGGLGFALVLALHGRFVAMLFAFAV